MLGTLPQDVEDSWVSNRTTIITAALEVMPVVQRARRPWLTAATLALLDKKRDARLSGHAINTKAFSRHDQRKT